MSSPAGNYYDKFGTSNPIARRLMAGFLRDFRALLLPLQVERILEVGCGEGHMLAVMRALKDVPMHGMDRDIPVLAAAGRTCPTAHILQADAHALPYAANSFDLVVACEVLEHVESPARVLQEIRRVGCSCCIVSVPREPLWRALNMIRGRYWRDLGNTPGHIQHWSAGAFVALLERHFRVVSVRQPIPWTMALCEITG